MKIIRHTDSNFAAKLREAAAGSSLFDAGIEQQTRKILDAIYTRGDDGLLECTERFDGAKLSAEQLAVTQAEVDKPFEYYFGACWDRSGDFTNHIQWENYVKRFAERRYQPLKVTVGN